MLVSIISVHLFDAFYKLARQVGPYASLSNFLNTLRKKSTPRDSNELLKSFPVTRQNKHARAILSWCCFDVFYVESPSPKYFLNHLKFTANPIDVLRIWHNT